MILFPTTRLDTLKLTHISQTLFLNQISMKRKNMYLDQTGRHPRKNFPENHHEQRVFCLKDIKLLEGLNNCSKKKFLTQIKILNWRCCEDFKIRFNEN